MASRLTRKIDYRDPIAAYIEATFGSRGIIVYTEIALGKTIIGKNRKLDIFALRHSDQRALGLECKYQDSLGTTDEKIPSESSGCKEGRR